MKTFVVLDMELGLTSSYDNGAGKDSLTDLAVEAARKALEMAEVTPDEVDLVLMCTSTPEDLFGSAPQVHTPDNILP